MSFPSQEKASVASTSNSSSTDMLKKENSLFEKSYYKVAKENLSQLCYDLSEVLPDYTFIIQIIGAMRLFLLLVPSLFLGYPSVWADNTSMRNLQRVITYFCYFSDSKSSDSVLRGIVIGYSLIMISFFIGLSYAAHKLSKKSKVSSLTLHSIAFMFLTVGYILHPSAGFAVSKLAMQVINKVDVIYNSIIVLLAFAIFYFYMWLFIYIYSVSLLFRPDSLLSAFSTPQTALLIYTQLLAFIYGIGNLMSEDNRIWCQVLCLILYISSSYVVSYYCYFVSISHQQLFYATSFSGSVFTLVSIILYIFGKRGTDVLFFSYIGIWIVAYFFSSIMISRIISQNLDLLDRFEGGETVESLFVNERSFIKSILIGITYTHPSCLDSSIFKNGTQVWPDSMKIWFLYSKITAIYPEQNNELIFIARYLRRNEMKGLLLKHTIRQVISLTKKREKNLIPELKIDLERVSKQVQNCKHKSRHTWDLIIQGNIFKLESSIELSKRSIDHCESEYQHLLKQYPNNRFLARSYARFVKEVKADHAQYSEWKQNVSQMHLGLNVKNDLSHTFGLHAFPLLPIKLDMTVSHDQTVDDQSAQMISYEDQLEGDNFELQMSIREAIKHIRIPSYSTTRTLRVISALFMFLIPIIAFCIYLPIYIGDISEPIDFMYVISELRAHIFMAIGVAHHYVLEKFGVLNPPIQIGTPPSSFGSTFESRNHTQFIINEFSGLLQNLSPLMTFKAGNSYMDKIRTMLFDNYVNFTTVIDATSPMTYQMMSVQAVLMQYILMFSAIVNMETFSSDIVKSKYLATPFTNVRPSIGLMNDALVVIRDYISDHQAIMDSLTNDVMYTVLISVSILEFILCAFYLSIIKKNKMMVYKCLISLPKNIVSKVTDSFRYMKSEDDNPKSSKSTDDDLNKQEENILKAFSMTSDSATSVSDSRVMVLATFLICILHISCTLLLSDYMKSAGNDLNDAAPHIDFLFSAYSYDFASVIALNMLIAEVNSFGIRGYTVDRISLVIEDWQLKGKNSFKAAKFGDVSLKAKPFAALSNALMAAKAENLCIDSDSISSFFQVYGCLPIGIILSYSQISTISTLKDFNRNKSKPINGLDHVITHLWHIHQSILCDSYFSPILKKVVPATLTMITSNLSKVIMFTVFLLFAYVLTELFVFMILHESEETLRFSMNLILHCPGNIIVTNQHFTNLLYGNFEAQNLDTTNRDSEFFEKLVNLMPDCILILSKEGTIVEANKACEITYGKPVSELIGKPVSSVGDSFEGTNPFGFTRDKVSLSSKDNFEGLHVYNKENGNKVHLQISFTVLPTNIIVTARDETQKVFYDQLICDERKKSDQLLETILPKRLVGRVIGGEKNISLTVKSSSIVFIDIVEFTPWCSSLPASQVMKTLNQIFREFDHIIQSKPTMTKIKCIGDCYMAAGGLLVDVNQPATHAKEAIEFGLEAIQVIHSINKEHNYNMAIRVGTHTGGPIVAGVIGTDKPTFEIFGPSIKIAQQMEHHGVPMKIQITRAVYELIYGYGYTIKERGEMQIAGQKMITYLIE